MKRRFARDQHELAALFEVHIRSPRQQAVAIAIGNG